ncbi:MAG TPA: hypothetical protein VHB02_02135 [Acidimicrobiales bacterium]|nr:hypothetical protein [Acidimicrobiales bacterium]
MRQLLLRVPDDIHRRLALGLLRPAGGPAVDPSKRRRIVGSTRGIGPVLDRLLAEERERG